MTNPTKEDLLKQLEELKAQIENLPEEVKFKKGDLVRDKASGKIGIVIDPKVDHAGEILVCHIQGGFDGYFIADFTEKVEWEDVLTPGTVGTCTDLDSVEKRTFLICEGKQVAYSHHYLTFPISDLLSLYNIDRIFFLGEAEND